MYPLSLNEPALAEITRQLKNFIQGSVRSARAKGAVVALSGGVDSSVVAALAHDVADTTALILPETAVTSAQDVLDATSIAEVYELPFTVIEINDLIDCFKEAARPILPARMNGQVSIAEANLKPRIRMTLSYVTSNADLRLARFRASPFRDASSRKSSFSLSDRFFGISTINVVYWSPRPRL